MDRITLTRDDLWRLLAAAYERGGAWMLENSGTPEFLSKAAHDYADKISSTIDE